MIAFRRDGLPVAPVEIADEVELYARAHGRHATVRFIPTRFLNGRIAAGTWTVRLSLRDDDPRLGLFKQGKVDEPPVEQVWLHEPDGKGGYAPYDLEALGSGGVKQFLEKGNMWGRGQFASLSEQFQKTQDANAAVREKTRTEARAGARDMALDKRRSVLGIPFVGVLKDIRTRFRQSAPSGAGPEAATKEQS
jgi:hypothetical protein